MKEESKKEEVKIEPKSRPKVEFTRYEIKTKEEAEKFINLIWPTIVSGLDVVIESSSGDLSKGIVLKEILNGYTTLWLGFVDGKYAGFATTAFNPHLDGLNFITIKQVYIKPGTGLEIFLKGQKKIFEFGKKLNCDKVRMVTNNLKERKALKRLGWKPTYQEFEINLKE